MFWILTTEIWRFPKWRIFFKREVLQNFEADPLLKLTVHAPKVGWSYTELYLKPDNCTKHYLSPVAVFKVQEGVFLIKLTRKILSREKFSFFVKTNTHFSHSTSQKVRDGGCYYFDSPYFTSWHSSFNFSRVVGILNLAIFLLNLFVSLSLIIKSPIGEKRI